MSVPVGILTVSDKCSRGKAVDTSGPALAQLLSEAKTNNRWVVVTTAIVPDDKNLIANTVQNWCTPKSYSAGGMHAEPLCRLVIVTGGTGISPSDVTVGAIEPLFTKRLPSLAMLCQVTAGVVCDAAIVLAVPGSKKGSVENVQQVLPALPHAVDTLMARSGTRHLHENVEDTSVDNREAAQAASRSVLCSCSREDEDTTDAGSATHSQHSPDTTITKPIARAANDLSASVVRRA
ncbi:MoaB/Mog domain-containing protein, partial [Coemansia spiralis]